MEKHINSKN